MSVAEIAFLVAVSGPAVCCGLGPPSENAALAWIQQGDRHFEAHEYQEAAAAYSQAIDAGDASVEAMSKRAKAYLHAKKTDLAVADANQIIAIDPNCAEAFYLRAAANRILGRHNHAVRDASKAISIRPTALAFNLRGTTYVQLKDYEAAIRDYSEAIRIDPKRVATYINRAHVHRERRDFGKAIADLSVAIRLDPNNPFAYELRSAAYEVSGRNEDARVDREQAAKLKAQRMEAPKTES